MGYYNGKFTNHLVILISLCYLYPCNVSKNDTFLKLFFENHLENVNLRKMPNVSFLHQILKSFPYFMLISSIFNMSFLEKIVD